jgi:hypothetical protein
MKRIARKPPHGVQLGLPLSSKSLEERIRRMGVNPHNVAMNFEKLLKAAKGTAPVSKEQSAFHARNSKSTSALAANPLVTYSDATARKQLFALVPKSERVKYLHSFLRSAASSKFQLKGRSKFNRNARRWINSITNEAVLIELIKLVEKPATDSSDFYAALARAQTEKEKKELL